jgi:putative alpha-1,2-mannosidase
MSFDDIQNGGTFQFEMTNTPNKNWGNQKEDVPYSLSKLN